MGSRSFIVMGAPVDNFVLDVWEEVDIAGKVMQIQCRKCWKIFREFWMRRRKTPMGTIVHDAECHRCHMMGPNEQKGAA
jgi:hypothetical protein